MRGADPKRIKIPRTGSPPSAERSRMQDTAPPNAERARTQQAPERGRGPARTCPKTQKGPRGDPIPRGPCRPPRPLARIEKRPPRARRPALPQPCAAVLSAKAGLTAGFGMGPGDPRLCGRARGGRSPAAHGYEPARVPFRGDPGGRAAKEAESSRRLAKSLTRMRRARAISSARLSGSPRLHLRPVDRVFYPGPYRKVDSSRRRLPA